ncbi:hypothetical protein NPIL_123491 [Nephila pilipes]|uniref:Uncharacterized protein n=1 Tax=Nephila pilipes TaxID=299642 RepID=A0A8X6TJ96_NEPPI|nr:hypothetical protein NPIL_123491 [Nephila pilipes]
MILQEIQIPHGKYSESSTKLGGEYNRIQPSSNDEHRKIIAFITAKCEEYECYIIQRTRSDPIKTVIKDLLATANIEETETEHKSKDYLVQKVI